MSSHHIVREKQEPALFLLGLAEFSYELLGQLLEWSPTVIATPETATILHANQIKIDWLVQNGPASDFQDHIKTLPINGNNYIAAVLQQLITDGYSAVNIVVNEFTIDDYLHYAYKIDLVIYQNREKIYPVQNGFSKWKPAGELIRIVSLAENLQANGLKLIAENMYETIHDGFISLQFPQPFIFIAEGI